MTGRARVAQASATTVGRRPAQEGALGGERHAHVRHEADDDEIVVAGRVDVLAEVRAEEGVRCLLGDDRFALDRRDARVDLPDLGPEVVRAALAAVVDDVDDLGALPAGAGQQPGARVERFLPAVEFHHAGRVGVLVVDEDQRGVGELGGGVVEPAETAQRGSGHGCSLGFECGWQPLRRPAPTTLGLAGDVGNVV
ncbi:hypothetical protein RKD37_006282 [Streptomyces ambofaciens]